MKSTDYECPDDGHGPLLRPSRVDGWGGLSSHLAMIGISTTANALENRRRRQAALPVRGGGVQGRPVYFTWDDIKVWVHELTGVRVERWLRKYRASQQVMHPVRSAPGEAGRAAILPRYELYAIMVPSLLRGEQVHRDSNGTLYASMNPWAFEDVFRGDDPPPGNWESCAFRGARSATDADLLPMSPSWRKRARQRASRLVGAFSQDGNVLRWIRVPAMHFGKKDADSTPFLASRALPRFGEAVQWIRSSVPAPVFVTWLRRVRVRAVTLEEVPSTGWTVLSDLISGEAGA